MTDRLFVVLTTPKRLKSEIQRLDERIEDTRLMMLPSAIRYDTDKVKSSPSDPMLKFAEKIDELEKKKEKLLPEWLKARDKLFNLIDRLTEDDYKKIIQDRFMNSKKFAQIVEEMPYVERQVYRKYSEAIEELESFVKCQ